MISLFPLSRPLWRRVRISPGIKRKSLTANCSNILAEGLGQSLPEFVTYLPISRKSMDVGIALLRGSRSKKGGESSWGGREGKEREREERERS